MTQFKTTHVKKETGQGRFSRIWLVLSLLWIRYKFFISFTVIFFLSMLLCNLLIYVYVRNNIENRIESELTHTTAMIYNIVNTSVNVSVENYLRAVAEKNLGILTGLYQNIFLGICLLFFSIMLVMALYFNRFMVRVEKQVMQAGDRERMNIGQALHDDLCPHLIGISGLAAVILEDLKSRHDPATDLARKMGALMENAVEKTRQLARGLCPVHLVNHGFQSALEEIAGQFAYYPGIRFDYRMDKGVDIPEDSCAIHLYHIAREAVNNAVKHSNCDHIKVSFTRDAAEGLIQLKVTDNGSGINSDLSGQGIGMQIMAYRAKTINAQFDIDTSPKGTQVRVILGSPLQDKN